MAKSLEDQLRQAIEQSGMTCYAIGKATGIDKGTLSRFMARKAGLSLASANSLIAVLGLELKPTVERKK
jgi:hypothetical protein